MEDYRPGKSKRIEQALIEDQFMAKLKLQWDADAWEEHLEWQTENKTMTKRINQLKKDMLRSEQVLYIYTYY